jgi:hypothetical protein
MGASSRIFWREVAFSFSVRFGQRRLLALSELADRFSSFLDPKGSCPNPEAVLLDG